MTPNHGDCHAATGLVKFAGPVKRQRMYASSNPTSHEILEHGVDD